MSCMELVELITEYLEGVLPPRERTRFETHLAECSACSNYLEQMRSVIRAFGHLDEKTIPADTMAKLMQAFSSWSSRR